MCRTGTGHRAGSDRAVGARRLGAAVVGNAVTGCPPAGRFATTRVSDYADAAERALEVDDP